ncbi:MAG TPA: hypothetical protein VIJ93_10735 [bacterium]
MNQSWFWLSWCATLQLFENIEGGTTPHDSYANHAKGVNLVPLVVQTAFDFVGNSIFFGGKSD